MMQKLSTAILVIAIVAGAGGLAEAAKDQWVIALGDEPHSLSPASKGPLPLASDYLQSHIYDALVDFAGPNLTLRPMLAERWENPTPTVWRFSLRRGVRFHNGDPLTAEDIKFTIDYQLANKGSTMNAYLGPTDNAKVIDPYTVEITTSAPFPALLFNLARVHIMPRALDKMGADAFAAKPIGSGAYKFVEWQRGQRIVLEANPDYWAGVPTPKRLLFRPIADPSTRAAELRAGGVDIITNPPLAQVRELNAGSTTVLPIEGGRVIAYPINTKKKPLDDVRIRRAINYAVDRDSIVKSLLGGFGAATGQPFAPAWLGYSSEIRPYPFDPNMAKRLLTEAGYPNGFDLTWNITTGVFLADKEIAQAAAGMLGDVGIRVRLIPTERAKIQQDLQTGTFDGITSGSFGTVAEPDVMVKWFFRTKIFNEQLDPKLSQLVAAGATEVDRNKRLKIYEELARFAHDEALWLFVHYQDELVAKRTDIEWQVLNARGGKTHLYYYVPAKR